MRRVVATIVLGAAACGSASPVDPVPPAVVDEPVRSAIVPGLPPADGEHLVIEQRPCPFGCPSYRLEVYGSGHVRWVGYAFVSRMKEMRFAIAPEEARALLERWHALDLGALPKTAAEAACATDVVPRSVVHVGADATSTERWEGLALDSADADALERSVGLDELLAAVDASTGMADLIKPERCWDFDSFAGAARVGDANAAWLARRQFEKHPGWFHIRISIVDTVSMRRRATDLLRTLVGDGVPRERILLEVLPPLPDTLLPELAQWGSGWVGVGTLRCLGEENE